MKILKRFQSRKEEIKEVNELNEEREYENIPAHEMIKKYVVLYLEELIDSYNQILFYFFLNRKDKKTLENFKSQVLSLYTFLKPKIEDSEMKKRLIKKKLDKYILNPKSFSLKDAIESLNFLIKFCEKYRIISTKIIKALPM